MFKKRLITISALPFVTALLLGSSLAISKKPEKVSAISENHEHDGWTGVTELPTSAGNYYLTADITLTTTWNVPEGTTNLCLNGHVINANGENFSVITMGEATTLNLYDCGDTSHNGYVDSNGLWHFGEGEGTAKTLTGGIITGGYFTNTSSSGGGVNVGRGEFNMYGGTIAGNKAGANGGGVFAGTGGKFTMSAGGIIFNKANAGGGAATQSGTFEINGGVVTDNNATNGGGIFNFNGSMTITGGSICNNLATTAAGGIYQYGNSVFGGTAQITGNTLNGISNNVFLANKKTITVGTDEKAPTTMSVGITTQTAPTEGNPVKITVDDAADYSAYFFSDSNDYKVYFNNGTVDYLELRKAYSITNNTKEAEKSTNNGYIEVIETAIKDEEVSVTVYPNQGYKLSSLVYNDGTQDHDIDTSTKSFTMQTTAVSITATFEEKQTISISEEPYHSTYNGEPRAFQITSGEGPIPTGLKFEYYIDGAWTETAPTNAGSYNVKITREEDDTYKAYEKVITNGLVIDKATISSVGFTDVTTPVAGETIPTTVSGIAIDAKYTGTLTWSPSGSSSSFNCDAEYKAIITLTITDGNIGNYQFADNVTLQGITGWTKSTTDCTDTKLVLTKTFEKTTHRSLSQVDGKTPTCTENGYMEAYYCSLCEKYFTDCLGENEIGNSTAYNDWILGDGKISALGHSMTHHAAVAPTCTDDGTVEYWECSHESGVYYADDQGTSTLASIIDHKLGHDIVHHDAKAPTCTEVGWEAYDTCSRCGYSTYVEIPALGHSLSEVAGKLPTCTEDGYMVAYKCSTCEMYFTDPAGEHKIGDETAYNAWKLNEGKIQARHVVSKASGVDPTKERSGYKEAWKCSECGQYFEDEACTILIGDETAYNAWKSAGGYLPQLPNEGLSGGAIAGICVGSVFFLLLVIYLIGYFFLYKKGKLDEKKIKVIYKFLPRGEKNLKQDDK